MNRCSIWLRYIYIYTHVIMYTVYALYVIHIPAFSYFFHHFGRRWTETCKKQRLEKDQIWPFTYNPHMSPISNFPIFLPRSPWLSVVLVVFFVARGVHRHGLHDRTPRGCYGVATQLSPSDDGGVSWPKMVEVVGHHQAIPSGYVKIAMERSTIFDGKIHSFNGHFQ